MLTGRCCLCGTCQLPIQTTLEHLQTGGSLGLAPWIFSGYPSEAQLPNNAELTEKTWGRSENTRPAVLMLGAFLQLSGLDPKFWVPTTAADVQTVKDCLDLGVNVLLLIEYWISMPEQDEYGNDGHGNWSGEPPGAATARRAAYNTFLAAIGSRTRILPMTDLPDEYGDADYKPYSQTLPSQDQVPYGFPGRWSCPLTGSVDLTTTMPPPSTITSLSQLGDWLDNNRVPLLQTSAPAAACLHLVKQPATGNTLADWQSSTPAVLVTATHEKIGRGFVTVVVREHTDVIRAYFSYLTERVMRGDPCVLSRQTTYGEYINTARSGGAIGGTSLFWAGLSTVRMTHQFDGSQVSGGNTNWFSQIDLTSYTFDVIDEPAEPPEISPIVFRWISAIGSFQRDDTANTVVLTPDQQTAFLDESLPLDWMVQPNTAARLLMPRRHVDHVPQYLVMRFARWMDSGRSECSFDGSAATTRIRVFQDGQWFAPTDAPEIIYQQPKKYATQPRSAFAVVKLTDLQTDSGITFDATAAAEPFAIELTRTFTPEWGYHGKIDQLQSYAFDFPLRRWAGTFDQYYAGIPRLNPALP